MGMNLKSISVFGFFVLMLASGTENVFADHGSGGGGGCSGDCTPPTLGQDKYGQVFVTDGISINGDKFDVDYFQQDVETQILKTGHPATVSLKIFENSGPSYLTHVFLMLGMEEKTISGVKVQSHPVQIVWERYLNEKPYVTTNDPNNYVFDVSVDSKLSEDAFGNENALNEIVFKFTPAQKFDTDTMLVEMWDFENNSWTNHFHNSIIIDDSVSEFSESIVNSDDAYHAPEIPNWFKNNAEFWAQNQIDDETFVVGIKYLIEKKIIHIPNLQKSSFEPVLHFIDIDKGSQHYLDRYYNDEIYKDWFDTNFPDYTIEEALGINPNPVIPDWIKNNALLWTDGMITDDDFLNGIEFLVKTGVILF